MFQSELRAAHRSIFKSLTSVFEFGTIFRLCTGGKKRAGIGSVSPRQPKKALESFGRKKMRHRLPCLSTRAYQSILWQMRQVCVRPIEGLIVLSLCHEELGLFAMGSSSARVRTKEASKSSERHVEENMVSMTTDRHIVVWYMRIVIVVLWLFTRSMGCQACLTHAYYIEGKMSG